MVNTVDNFVAGKVYRHRHQWRGLTSDFFINQLVHGEFLEFIPNKTVSSNTPFPTKLSKSDSLAVDSALREFLAQ